MLDQTKLLLFVALSLGVLILISGKGRPLASAPKDGNETVGESQTAADQELIATGPFLNVPSNNAGCLPLSLMMPNAGGSPTV